MVCLPYHVPFFPSLCLFFFILHPFQVTFGTCQIFINSLASLPRIPGMGWDCWRKGQRDGGGTGVIPVLGDRGESSALLR